MTIISATAARRGFFDILKSAARQHKIFRIHHRGGDTVLISEEDYESLLETLKLLSIPGFGKSLQQSVRQMNKGETISFSEVFGETK